jgi:hypothetical protein
LLQNGEANSSPGPIGWPHGGLLWRIPSGKKVTRVTTFLPTDFTHHAEGDILHVTLPTIDKYQGIIIEMR